MSDNDKIDLLNYCSIKLGEVINIIYNKSKPVTEAITILEELVTKTGPALSKKRSFCFNSEIESIIFTNRFNNDDRFDLCIFPMNLIRYYLGEAYTLIKDDESAEKEYKLSFAWDPFYIDAYFSLANLFLRTLRFDKLKMLLDEAYKYIYDAKNLSQYYMLLGDYYINIKDNDLAVALYKYSSEIYKNPEAEVKLSKLNNSKSDNILIENNEIINRLKNNNIPLNILSDNLNQLYNIFLVSKTVPEDKDINESSKQILWDLTKDENFATTIKVDNKEYGFQFNIPSIWKCFTPPEGNTLYSIALPDNINLNVEKIKDITDNNLLKNYTDFKNEMIAKQYYLVNEGNVKNKNINYVQCFLYKRLLNEDVVMVHNIIVINDALVDFSIIAQGKYNKDNMNQMFNDKNAIRVNNILESLQIYEKYNPDYDINNMPDII